VTPAERIERIRTESSGVEAQCGIKSADKVFMANIESRQFLSAAQEKWLSDIEARVFGEDD